MHILTCLSLMSTSETYSVFTCHLSLTSLLLLHTLFFVSLHFSISPCPCCKVRLISTCSLLIWLNDRTFLICPIYLIVPWTNKVHPPPTHTHTQRTFLFSSLDFLELRFSFLSSARPPYLFATVPILWGHHFTSVCFSFSSFPFVRVHCVWLPSTASLCSFPPPLLLCLCSIITAVDSSSDGKCFLFPFSPSLSFNLHRSLFLTKQITYWLL